MGQPAEFLANTDANSVAALDYRWEFGDGTRSSGSEVRHTFTHAGDFTIHLTAEGIEGVPFEKTQQISVSGSFDSTFNPQRIIRRKK